jgi:hypothetical protein
MKLFGYLRIIFERQGSEKGTFIFIAEFIYIHIKYPVEVGRLHTPEPNTFKLSFSQFLTFNTSKNPCLRSFWSLCRP